MRRETGDGRQDARHETRDARGRETLDARRGFAFLVSCILTSSFAFAGNLFPQGDFTDLKAPGVVARASGGTVSIFQEPLNWNKCLKIEVTRNYTNEQGRIIHVAHGIFGSDGKAHGFPVKPNTRYDVTMELKGNVKRASMEALVTTNETGKSVELRLEPKYPPVHADWSKYKGSFKTPANARRAELGILMWSSSEYAAEKRFKVGDAIYVDNVKVEESPDNEANLFAPSAPKGAAPVPAVKALAEEVKATDFGVLKSLTKAGATLPPTALSVKTAGDACVVTLDCSGGDGFGKEDVEVFFEPLSGAKLPKGAQFILSGSGRRHTRIGTAKRADLNDAWQGAFAACDGGYRATLSIPWKLLGYDRTPSAGEAMGFNVCRTLSKSRVFGTFAPVEEGYHEPKNFARLVVGTYQDALKKNWKSDAKAADRASFEAAVQTAETTARDAEYAKLAGRTFVATPVKVDSDYACPFVPREVFRPQASVSLRAPVNARIALPVAVMNLKDVAAAYRVTLETVPTKADLPDKTHPDHYTGAFGLKGFPPSAITCRQGERIKDTAKPPVTTRLDILPKMNECCSVTAGPREAALAWFDFDLEGVRPGTYEGRVRVIPLCEPGDWVGVRGSWGDREWKGERADIAVTLEVLPFAVTRGPAAPFGFFQHAQSESMLDLMDGVGTRVLMDGPGASFEKDKDGNLLLDKPKPELLKSVRHIREQVEWAAKRGFRPKFFLGFHAYPRWASDIMGMDWKSPEYLKKWPQCVKAIEKKMAMAGLTEADYDVELFDEPHAEWRDMVLAALRVARETSPKMRLSLTMGASNTPVEDLRAFAQYTDIFVMWDGYFGEKQYRDFVAEQLAAGKEVWHYTCSESVRTPICRNYHLHAWFAEHYKLTGSQFFIFYDAGGGWGMRDYKTPPMSGISYPHYGDCLPSLRYMAMRDGVEEVKCLAKLRAVAAENPAAAEDPAVKELLATAAKRVMETELHDESTAGRVREETLDLLLRYAREF